MIWSVCGIACSHCPSVKVLFDWHVCVFVFVCVWGGCVYVCVVETTTYVLGGMSHDRSPHYIICY